jgi:hypothetical protein
MTDTPKTLTRDDYLRALALYTVAMQDYRKCRQFEHALAHLLGRKDNNDLGHIGDFLYNEQDNFDEALRREGFAIPDLIEPEKPEKKQ